MQNLLPAAQSGYFRVASVAETAPLQAPEALLGHRPEAATEVGHQQLVQAARRMPRQEQAALATWLGWQDFATRTVLAPWLSAVVVPNRGEEGLPPSPLRRASLEALFVIGAPGHVLQMLRAFNGGPGCVLRFAAQRMASIPRAELLQFVEEHPSCGGLVKLLEDWLARSFGRAPQREILPPDFLFTVANAALQCFAVGGLPWVLQLSDQLALRCGSAFASTEVAQRYAPFSARPSEYAAWKGPQAVANAQALRTGPAPLGALQLLADVAAEESVPLLPTPASSEGAVTMQRDSSNASSSLGKALQLPQAALGASPSGRAPRMSVPFSGAPLGRPPLLRWPSVATMPVPTMPLPTMPLPTMPLPSPVSPALAGVSTALRAHPLAAPRARPEGEAAEALARGVLAAMGGAVVAKFGVEHADWALATSEALLNSALAAQRNRKRPRSPT